MLRAPLELREPIQGIYARSIWYPEEQNHQTFFQEDPGAPSKSVQALRLMIAQGSFQTPLCSIAMFVVSEKDAR